MACMDRRRRRILLAYAIALPLIMFGVNYVRGRGQGESPGPAALVSLIVLGLVAAIWAWLLYDAKRKGRNVGWKNFDGSGHPGEGSQPPGWRWDEHSKQWKKPPRQGA